MSFNFIIISPHYPENFQLFATRLNESGATVLGIADESYDNLSPLIREALTEYYRVDDMENYHEMYRAVAYFAHQYGGVHRLESHNEHWLEMDARLRTDFNIPGLKAHEMDRLKQKNKMKAVFRSINVPVANGRVFEGWEDASKLVSELGYPVIIKPNIGVGASDTWRISSDEELSHFFVERNSAETFIMEEFIDGDIVTFDGLTDQDGNIVFSQNMVYDKPALEIISQNMESFVLYPKEMPEDIWKLGKQCVEAFEIKERFFHFEFFRLKSDQSLVALEVNCRPPGGPMIEMFNYANNLDIYAQYAQVVLNNQFTADLSQRKNCGYVSRKYYNNYLYTQDDIYAWYGEFIVSSVMTEGVFGDFGYFIVTDTLSQMQAVVHFIQELA